MSEIIINLSKKDDIKKLRELHCGTFVLLSGRIYSARDAAHKKIEEAFNSGKNIPVDFKDSIIYYMGPTPTRPGNAIGSCGPTSSYRMDDYLETTLKLGISATLGKGERSDFVVPLIKKYQSPYLITIGGASAKLAESVVSAKTVLFEDLLSEAVRELEVRDFPVIVGIDIYGKQIFKF